MSETNESRPVDPDTESDPALADEAGRDWSDEGGATEQGPATAPDADDQSR